MVPSFSALLDIAEETSKSVAYNHSEMAKIVSPTDEPYPTIKDRFQGILEGVKRSKVNYDPTIVSGC